MTTGRVALYATAALVVVVTAATGTPLWSVPADDAGTAPLGQGQAEVTVVSMPDTATIEAGRQGGGVYYLRVPDAQVNVTALQGNPILTYSVDVDALGYSRSSVVGLAGVGEGPVDVTMPRDTLDGEQLQRDQYEGRVRLVLRGSDGETALYSEPVTVEVQR